MTSTGENKRKSQSLLKLLCSGAVPELILGATQPPRCHPCCWWPFADVSRSRLSPHVLQTVLGGGWEISWVAACPPELCAWPRSIPPCAPHPDVNHLRVQALPPGPNGSRFNARAFLTEADDLEKQPGWDVRTRVSLTSRVGEHQPSNVASNHGQAREDSAGQDAKLAHSNNTRGSFPFSFNDFEWWVLGESHINMDFRINTWPLPFRGFPVCTWAGRSQGPLNWPRLQRCGGTIQARWGCRAAPDPSYTVGQKHRSPDHQQQPNVSVPAGLKVTNLSCSGSSSFLTERWRERNVHHISN